MRFGLFCRPVGRMRSGEAGPGPEGTVMSVTFVLDGQERIAWTSELCNKPTSNREGAPRLVITSVSPARVTNLYRLNGLILRTGGDR